MPNPSAEPLVLTDEIKDMVNNGLANGTPLLLAAVGVDGKPQISFRGSAQTYGDDAIGLWIRNTSGGTIEAIRANPNVALMYRSPTTPMLKFEGRARIAGDKAERDRVYEAAPERERQSDPERTGAAVIVELDSVEGVLGFGENGPRFCRLARKGG